MSRRFGDPRESRWSSERDRLERERQQREFDAKPPRSPRRSAWRAGSAGSEPEPETTPAGPSVPEPIDSDAERSSGVGRKWRDSVEPPPESALPDLPGDGGDGDSGGRSSKALIIFGAVLFLLMGVFAFLPFGPLGSDDDASPTATQSVALVPTAPEQDPDRSGKPTAAVAERPAGSGYVVCLDAGHGGWDFGRQRKQGEVDQPWLNESEVNLGMAYMLRTELEARGVTVVMTRPTGLAANAFGEDVNNDGRTILDGTQHGDRDELQARINICNASDADVLVSLHLNGYDEGNARGYEVLYTGAREFGDQNLDLATAIYRRIGAAYKDAGFETQARGTKDDIELDAETHEFGSEQHLVLTGPAVTNPDYTIVPSNMPGVIIEPVFITNQDDASFIAIPENQELLAKAYADGIMDYFDKHP